MENEEEVYQYYTIIDDSSTFLTDSPLIETLEHDKIMYFSFGEQEETNIPEETLQNKDEDEDEGDISNIKFILEDGQMYFTDVTLNEEQDSKLISSHAEETKISLEGEEETKVKEENNYREVQLEDGTCAYIDKSLWNTLMDEELIEKLKDEVEVTITPPAVIKTEKIQGTAKEKKFPCIFYGCNKIYSTSHHLTVHIRNHTGQRPYQCTHAGCVKAFATGYSLKAHLRTHTGETPYSCTVCPKSFKTSGDLQKHTRTHTGEKPFKCPIEGCGRSFTTSNIRKVHIRSHTGERPYSCSYPDCGKAFASATNFKNHMRIHSGEKPYACPVPECGKRFTEYSSLFKHNTVHKSFKPLKCEYCDQLCKHESTLKSHKQTMHKILVTEDGTEIHLTKERYGGRFFTETAEDE